MFGLSRSESRNERFGYFAKNALHDMDLGFALGTWLIIGTYKRGYNYYRRRGFGTEYRYDSTTYPAYSNGFKC